MEEAEKEVENEAVTCFTSQDPSVIDCGDEMNEEPSAGMDLVVCEEQTIGKEHDSCLGDFGAESEKPLPVDANQGLDLDINSPQEMSQMLVTDVSVLPQTAEPAMEMGPKLELAQNIHSVVTVQVESAERDPPAEEQGALDHVTKPYEQVDELMDFRPAIPLEKAEEMEHKPVECFASQESTGYPEEMGEQPSVGVDFVITEEQVQDEQHDSCLGDLAESEKPLQESVPRGPYLGLDAAHEMSKMFADVSPEQSEPAMEMNPTVEEAQDLCCVVQVQTVEDTEEMSPPLEEQGEHGSKMCDKLMEFIPSIPLEKDQEVESEAETDVETSFWISESQEKVLAVELEADPDFAAVIDVIGDVLDFESETLQGSDTTSDTIEGSTVETERLAAEAASSDQQKASDAEEPTASTVTHLTLRIEDTSDDIIFVKEWQVSQSEASVPSSKE